MMESQNAGKGNSDGSKFILIRSRSCYPWWSGSQMRLDTSVHRRDLSGKSYGLSRTVLGRVGEDAQNGYKMECPGKYSVGRRILPVFNTLKTP